MKLNLIKLGEELIKGLGVQLLFSLTPLLSIAFLSFPFVAMYLLHWKPIDVFVCTATEVFGFFLTSLSCWSVAFLIHDIIDFKKLHLLIKIPLYLLFYTACCYIIYKFVILFLNEKLPPEGILAFTMLSALSAILTFEKGLFHAENNLIVAGIVLSGLILKKLGFGPLPFFLVFTALRIACVFLFNFLLKSKRNVFTF
ncbi:MAG: hypothetical protein IT236_12310 [Bacteroidia bacterium]|nr:hypothetical protein [Bacteroidia bacterium]